MHIYLTDSQVPELKPLPRIVRRLVIRRALVIMRSHAPLFCWVPTLFCIVGGVAGSFLGATLVACFHEAPATFGSGRAEQGMVWSLSGTVLGACTAGFIGLHLQRWKMRPYLRRVIDDFVC
jgi:hypothetical protein